MRYTTSSEMIQENPSLSRDQAYKLVQSHSASWFDFLTELGRRDTYKAREVLLWLGY